MATADGGNVGKQSDAGRDQAMSWLADYGDDLMGYACSRVRSIGDAEDLVQETFLAAVRGYESFRHESSAKTWLLGILRRKIVDFYRARAKSKREFGWDDESEKPPFNKHGNWTQSALSWPHDPKNTLDDREFRDVFQACLQKLNPMLAQAFVLRAMDQSSDFGAGGVRLSDDARRRISAEISSAGSD